MDASDLQNRKQSKMPLIAMSCWKTSLSYLTFRFWTCMLPRLGSYFFLFSMVTLLHSYSNGNEFSCYFYRYTFLLPSPYSTDQALIAWSDRNIPTQYLIAAQNVLSARHFILTLCLMTDIEIALTVYFPNAVNLGLLRHV